MRVGVVNLAGERVGEVDLPPILFQAPLRRHLLWEAVRVEEARRRRGTHATKTRGEVSGGGRKPWRQKGTGRARQGSIRAPQWRGGGVVFGPKVRSYDLAMTRKAKRRALFGALSARARASQVLVLDDGAMEVPRTKTVVAFLAALGEKTPRRPLFVLVEDDRNLALSVRNIPGARYERVESLAVRPLLASDLVIFTRKALEAASTRWAAPSAAPKASAAAPKASAAAPAREAVT